MTKKIKCVIIDDQLSAIDVMKCYIDQTPEFEIVGVCRNTAEALDILKNKEINVIFCNIDMPGINGLQLFKSNILNQDILIVIVTTHPRYAIEGLGIDVVDYLLKPVSFARYLKATQKIIYQIENKSNLQNPQKKSLPGAEISNDHSFLKRNGKYIKLIYDEIIYLEGLGDYVKIHFDNANKSILILDSLKNMDELLPDDRFKRIHRSYIINISKINVIEYKKIIVGTDNITLPIGSTYYEEIYDFFISNNHIR